MAGERRRLGQERIAASRAADDAREQRGRLGAALAAAEAQACRDERDGYAGDQRRRGGEGGRRGVPGGRTPLRRLLAAHGVDLDAMRSDLQVGIGLRGGVPLLFPALGSACRTGATAGERASSHLPRAGLQQ